MYRIIIADDEPLIIRGLKKMMEWGKMDTEVVGEAEDGEQLLNLLDTLEPVSAFLLNRSSDLCHCFKRNK